ncbi:unnamed protein product [Aspergillus oryzae]|nr:unnamed protein product [Aspergillus oryzae]GMF90822.1 unnamed protein product [Aspergillus oryzae]
MAASQAANIVEKVVGHNDNATVTTDVSNYNKGAYGQETGEKIKATTWQGKNSVQIAAIDGRAGSSFVLGVIPQLEKGDVLGHEFCGVVESVGPTVKKVKAGDRVVAAFPIACGECRNCKEQLTSACERTNENSITNAMYGKRTAGTLLYVRVPYGDVNLLQLPADVPDEKGLYLSDVLATAYHCVVDTGVRKGDVVAIWGGGPIGQMAAEYSFSQGATRVILIDGGEGAWRLDFVTSKIPKLETIDFSNLPRGESITSQLKKIVPGGPDVALECAAGEYAKGWAHYFEMLLGMETDTSEILNEMITAVRPFGRIGVTGVYAGYVRYRSIEHGGWDLKSMILVKPSKNFPSVPSIKLWSQSAMLNKVNEIRPFKRSSMDGLAYYGIRMIR